MGFGSSSLFAKIGFILIIVALVIQILGMAIPYWYELDFGIFSYHSGIFRSCVDIGSSTSCDEIRKPIDWQAAVQAMEIIGLISIIVALVLSIITVFVKDMKVLKLICWILCFFACACIIIGIIIFGAKLSDTLDDKYSGAFAITIIAGIVILIAGIMVLLDWMGKGGKVGSN